MDDIARFFQAVEVGDLEAVRAMVAEHPALVHARDPDGATALHHAVFNANRPLVELLLATGAELNARDHTYGATPTGWAIHYLRELGGLLAIEIEDVLFAIRNRDAAWVRRLVLRHPALRSAADRDGKPLVVYAEESGDAEIVRVFVTRDE
jgi:ankyrin repeat protein